MNFSLQHSSTPWRNRSVLVVDDEPGMRMALEMSFRQRGWQVEAAASKSEAIERFRERHHPLMVSDVRMPDGDGFELMGAVRTLAPQTSVIMLTAFAGIPEAVQAVKLGAYEYLPKPVAFEQLLDLCEELLSSRKKSDVSAVGGMVGSSSRLLGAIAQANKAAESDADVLIEAESGTGKELLAHMIHARSSRRERPFVAVNCAALPEALLESELFGYARGAFTGALDPHAGKFEMADGGTLLLDEVGEMPLALQPKLLRVLQEREFYRLGGNKPVRVNVRVIATSNRKLADMIQSGTFRADLYYRLNVLPLSLPPLRERREDIRELALYFAQMFSPDSSVTLPASLLAQMEGNPWPGNVRELANFVRRFVALGPDSVPAMRCCDQAGPSQVGVSEGDLNQRTAIRLSAGVSLAMAEKGLLEMTLQATGGNRSRAAEMLGISLRTVRNKIREYQLPARREYARLLD